MWTSLEAFGMEQLQHLGDVLGLVGLDAHDELPVVRYTDRYDFVSALFALAFDKIAAVTKRLSTATEAPGADVPAAFDGWSSPAANGHIWSRATHRGPR